MTDCIGTAGNAGFHLSLLAQWMSVTSFPKLWIATFMFPRMTLPACCLFLGTLVLQAEPIPFKSAIPTFQSASGGNLAEVIDDIESGPHGWSVAPKFTEPQALVVCPAKPVTAAELDITLFFLSGIPNGSIADFALEFTTDAEPSLTGNWKPLVVTRYAAEVVNLLRISDGRLRASGAPGGVNGVIPDDTYRLSAQLPGGRATGFRLRAFPLSNAAGVPYSMSWSHRHDFMLTEFRVAEHVRPTTNIALHCPVRCSHRLYGSMVPWALTDGLPSTIAHPLDEHLGSKFHFDIDLGRSATLDHIALLNRGDEWADRMSRVLVQVYENDPNTGAKPVWEGLDRADGSQPAVGERDVIRSGLGSGVFRGRYLRLSSDSPVPNSPQFAEVEAYESRTMEVESVLADGKEVPFNGGLDLPPGVRRLSLRVRIPQVGLPTGNLFRWRVRGDLDEWQVSRELTIDMPCPPPGKTLFEAQSLHSDREWDGAVFGFPIVARQHLWDTRGFQATAGGAALLISALLVRGITRRRAARQLALANARTALADERARIARDLHDDVGANLVRIGLLTEIAGRSLNEPDNARIQLDKIYKTADELTRQLRSVVWAVDPANDTLESLARHLHGYAEESLGMAGIRCHFTTTDAMPEIRLTSAIRHALLMIAKEAIHNIIKHAGATLATFSIAVEDRRIVIEIADNGRGTPPSDKLQPGNGLANMRTRAAAIGAVNEVLPARAGTGTLVRLILPLPV